MSTHIALLRAVNLGSHNKIPMADLRSMFETLGLRDAQTLLQTGNVVFAGGARSSSQLELLLERGAEKNLGLATPFFVRNTREWRRIVADNPFEREAARDPGHLVLLTLKQKPSAADVAALRDSVTGRETIHVSGTHAYVVYPDGIGRSKFTVALIERRLGTKVTGRNWNTVLKILALLS